MPKSDPLKNLIDALNAAGWNATESEGLPGTLVWSRWPKDKEEGMAYRPKRYEVMAGDWDLINDNPNFSWAMMQILSQIYEGRDRFRPDTDPMYGAAISFVISVVRGYHWWEYNTANIAEALVRVHRSGLINEQVSGRSRTYANIT